MWGTVVSFGLSGGLLSAMMITTSWYLDSVGAFTVQSIYITGGTPASSEPPQHKTTTSAATTFSSRSSSPASRTGYPCLHHANFGGFRAAVRTADEGGRAGVSAPIGPTWDVAIDSRRAVHNAEPAAHFGGVAIAHARRRCVARGLTIATRRCSSRYRSVV
eukprot:COSAG01_NODE_12624_length_1709_cov_2.934783_2_plen_161_part_00